MATNKRAWVYDVLLVLVLLVGTYFRVVGLNWDTNQHLHPDERFLTMVESALQVKKCALPETALEACPQDQIRWLGPADYLDTPNSPLNPQNRGYGFFVYGDFPIVVVRYIAEWVGQVGYDQVNLVGREVSALSDLLTILILYLIASRLYDRRVALLAAAFSALAVEQIQQSHFFIVDNVANLFIFLALWFAVDIALRPRKDAPPADAAPRPRRFPPIFYDRFLLLSLGFGGALGLAVASKLNAAPLAIVLPLAFAVRYFATDRKELEVVDAAQVDEPTRRSPTQYWSRIMLYLLAGALASAVYSAWPSHTPSAGSASILHG